MWRFLFLLLPTIGWCQLQFQQTLRPLQLIPRTTESTGTFQWRFQLSDPSFSRVSLVVRADGQPYAYFNLPTSTPAQPFQVSTTLEAKSQEYSFLFYLHRGNDSTLAHQVDRVVCGDFIVLYGQSNMVAQADYETVLASVDDRLLRNFTFNQDQIQLNQLTWFPSKQPYGHTGGVGLNLQKRILQETGIPTCVINGAQGGASIVQLFDRNPALPNDLRTQYGRLITRIQQAGANSHIRAFLWRQGENELCGNPDGILQYPARFTNMFQAFQQDVGFNGFFYNVQLAIQSCVPLEEGGILRDWIRRTPLLFPSMRAITAIGVPIYDGAHHDRLGYEQLTGEIYQLIRSDLYNRPSLPEVHFPTIQRIEQYENGQRLDLVFQENQRFTLPKDSVILNRLWRVQDHFFVNQTTNRSTPNAVDRISVQNNRIQIHLTQPSQTGFVTYLPSFLTTDPPFIGATLSNRLGRRVLSFYQFPIQSPLLPPHVDSVWYTQEGTQFFIQPTPGFTIQAQRQILNDWETVPQTQTAVVLDTQRCASPAAVTYRFRWTQGENVSEWSALFEIPCHPREITEPENEIPESENEAPEDISWGKRIRSRDQLGRDAIWQFQHSVELFPGFVVPSGQVFQTQRFTLPPIYFPRNR